ncbi:unnamed protein product [Paramecium sonneborni]|uniref:Uncharacterized protein n=1 Tax=Paramecium sonneborni TaxID=65129 RepID=A0A8S1NNL5_9CILI|nr:unnamed protein product [Paramecium sonneborni]
MSLEQQQSKQHKLQNYYHQFEKGQITGTQLKSELQTNLKIRWNSNLENIIHQVDPSYTDFVRSINKTNQYVPKKTTAQLTEQINYPKKIRTEHIGHTDLLKWD